MILAVTLGILLAAAGILFWHYQNGDFRRARLKYTPRGDRVIVRRLPPPAAKQGEVLIPGSQRKELNEGIVIAVGPHRDLADLKPGQHICFLDFAGTPVEVDGQEYLSLRETEIHGVRR